MQIKMVEHILQANDAIAAENSALLKAHSVFEVNMMGSPGSGKTAILERTLERLKELRIGVIEGDITTTMDADRLARFEVPITQINTDAFGGDCHLAAHVIKKALESFDLSTLDLLFVENVGNLVCPAEFEIGENRKVVVLSITEGEDKPLKYPLMFRVCHSVLINKMDLSPHLDIDLERLRRNIHSVNPKLEIIEVSAKTGQGIEDWVAWLQTAVQGG